MKYIVAFFSVLLGTMGAFGDEMKFDDVLHVVTDAGHGLIEVGNSVSSAVRVWAVSSSPSPKAGNGISRGTSPSRKEGKEIIFDENWGPKARILGQIAQESSDALDNFKAWAEGLGSGPLALVIVVAIILLVGSFWAYFSYLPVHGIPSGVRGGALTASVVAGLAFTGWLAFHASGEIGEYLAVVIMGLMGLSAALALIGGIVYGQGMLCKLVAPVLMLVVSCEVFFISMAAILLIIVLVFAVFAFDFLRKAVFGGSD